MDIDTLEELRDVCIISYTMAGTILFIIGIFFALLIGVLSFATVRQVRSTINTTVQPTLENVRETSSNVRGTVVFVSDYAVKPIVRSYGMFAGARRFVVVVSRLTRGSGG